MELSKARFFSIVDVFLRDCCVAIISAAAGGRKKSFFRLPPFSGEKIKKNFVLSYLFSGLRF